MEKTLVLIKPDAVEKNLIGEIISYYEKAGLKVLDIRMEKITREFAEKHYNEHKGRVFFEPLIEFIIRSPLCALVIEGNNAIEKVREINGSTDPEKAKDGTIRKSLATSNRENCVHASDSIENAKKEIGLWFPSV